MWTAKDGKEAVARIDREQAAGAPAAVVLCDVKMPGLDGLGVLEALGERPSAPAVIMISGHGDVATAVDAVRRGAVDFIEKPLDQNRVLVSIRNALRERRLESENTGLRRQLGRPLAAGGREPGHEGPGRAGGARRRLGRVGADHRRERHGQGGRRPADPPAEPAGPAGPS